MQMYNLDLSAFENMISSFISYRVFNFCLIANEVNNK